FFFFQAEDGIRDLIVTGVQTCALPIFLQEPRVDVERPLTARRLLDDHRHQRHRRSPPAHELTSSLHSAFTFAFVTSSSSVIRSRSEERRVGKECRSRWAEDD